MQLMWQRTLLAAVSWSAIAEGQTLPAPPVPPSVPMAPPPAPPLPPPPPPAAPASGDVTSVRSPDTAAAPAAPVDQGPDILPSLDEEPVTQPPPAKKAAPAAAVRPPLPIRAERRIALLGELGWNGLAGFGAIVAYHVDPHVTIELGAGLALVGGKLGLRGRYNFSQRPFTPFIGVGFMGATGYEAPSRDLNAEDNSELNIELRPSAFTQAVVGVDWISQGGFSLVGALGYAFLVSGENVVILTGVPTPDEEEGLDIVFGSGLVISIALGYTFR
jgi:hypothetical protein